MILKPGDSGPEVEKLQLKLKAVGYDPGDVDGDYGKRTTAAVLAFQLDRPDVDDDGIACAVARAQEQRPSSWRLSI